MGWLEREMARAAREKEQKEVDAFFGRSKRPKLKVPKGAPCGGCIQKIGCSVCRTHCGYWKKLQEMAKRGELEHESL